MAISAIKSSVSYAGNNSNVTAYPITFSFIDVNHIEAYVNGVLLDPSFYSVSQSQTGNEGSLITSISYPEANIITIRRRIPLDQPFAYREGDLLPAKNLEDNADYQLMQIQQIQETLDRTPTFPIGKTFTTNIITLAENRTWGTDSEGEIIERTIEEQRNHLGIPGFEASINQSFATFTASQQSAYDGFVATSNSNFATFTTATNQSISTFENIVNGTIGDFNGRLTEIENTQLVTAQFANDQIARVVHKTNLQTGVLEQSFSNHTQSIDGQNVTLTGEDVTSFVIQRESGTAFLETYPFLDTSGSNAKLFFKSPIPEGNVFSITITYEKSI